eukprot:4502646-Pleurochrysis_carterae.AAC.2
MAHARVCAQCVNRERVCARFVVNDDVVHEDAVRDFDVGADAAMRTDGALLDRRARADLNDTDTARKGGGGAREVGEGGSRVLWMVLGIWWRRETQRPRVEKDIG